ncbi:MAG: PAS domain-containing protein [Anaerolineaceae bacterium]|nr:PAS domain-containing protein [Anaerolineaceae bacterium]MBN2678461.1 PAS domain-containing protein [Anaerolineaceae bacterium]
MKQYLAWRITIPIVILVICGMVLLGIYQADTARNIYISDLVSNMRTEAEILIGLVEKGVNDPSDELNNTVQNYADIFNARITIINTDGVVLADSEADQNQMENHLARPEILMALGGKEGVEIRYSKTLDKEMLYVAEPVTVSGKVIGVIRLSTHMDQLKSITNQIVKTMLVRVILVTILIVILAIVIINRLLHPLHDLTNAARTISSGNYIISPIHSTRDELGILSDALHQMTKKIQSDISELESQTSKLNAILSRMSDGVIITDSRGKILLMNPAASHIFRMDSHKTTGGSLTEVVRHHQIIRLWEKCVSTGQPQTIALDLRTERAFLQCIVIPPDEPQTGFYLCLFQDLTELRRLEMVRQDFISNVSHELRTPLASMKAITETLQEGALNDQVNSKRFLTHMEIEIDRMTQLVDELMSLDRLESGAVTLNKKPCHTKDLVIQTVERMQMQAKRAGLSFSTDIDDDLPAIEVDGGLIEQVLVNLIHNAIKFTAPGGLITIAVKNKTDALCFSIRDTGLGIEPELLGRIFERFYKTDKARSSSGTGLGLSIARHTVEAHGGKIWAESKVGEGSTFYFNLPIARPVNKQ